MYLTAHTIGNFEISTAEARRVAAIYIQDPPAEITRESAELISEQSLGTRVYEHNPDQRRGGYVRAYVDFVAVDDITVEELQDALAQLEARVRNPYTRYAIWIEAPERWILRFSTIRGLAGSELEELVVLREDLIASLEAWISQGRSRQPLTSH
jgi:hypothetical protein